MVDRHDLSNAINDMADSVGWSTEAEGQAARRYESIGLSAVAWQAMHVANRAAADEFDMSTHRDFEARIDEVKSSIEDIATDMMEEKTGGE